MRKYSKGLSDREMSRIVDELSKALRKECANRGNDEYVDDVSWGEFVCRIPIFVDIPVKNPSKSRLPFKAENVATFEFHYDPDDEDYSAEEQAHIQLDEFLEDWNYEEEFEDEEYESDEFIEQAISDVVNEIWSNRKKYKNEDEIWDAILDRLEESPYNLIYDEDFYSDDILTEMEEYFWK